MISRTRPSFTALELTKALLVARNGNALGTLSRDLAAYFGVADVVLTGSGRAGLFAVLRAMGRRRVVVPAYTCNAVVEAALLAGCEITFVDCAPNSFQTDPSDLGPVLGEDCVYVATHQFGIPCAIEETVQVCHDHGAFVVEDCAASLGTRVNGQLTGTFGDAAFFSFDMSKLLTVPLKGGAVITPDTLLLEAIRHAHHASTQALPKQLELRSFAMGAALLTLQHPKLYRAFHRNRFHEGGTFTAETPLGVVERGPFYRYTMTNAQAQVVLAQFARIEALIAERRSLYAFYRGALSPAIGFSLPPADEHSAWAPIRFPIRVHDDKLAFYRESARRGVDFAFSFTFIEAPATCARAHAHARQVLDLPFYSGLTEGQRQQVVDTILAVDRDLSHARC
ncbi:DegT/DnrJ/EryC1/StrS aminotransferase family protein [Mycobacterium sp. TY814]|uniref:DegT/DnrJ/EryC1/StrS family aminotransferase n=1 Tax=unclassified Mycobacterium TaxID=2642494 RepID=UPI0027406A50|nr:DegT/DnrJ/EryC1/StrS family aminotransferase [Mycobacterium sp. TY814]MDP7720892.1 DegT/DnrJ/EryC1/StrS family aminotransferase [Mycobacterium sp. TY814]